MENNRKSESTKPKQTSKKSHNEVNQPFISKVVILSTEVMIFIIMWYALTRNARFLFWAALILQVALVLDNLKNGDKILDRLGKLLTIWARAKNQRYKELTQLAQKASQCVRDPKLSTGSLETRRGRG